MQKLIHTLPKCFTNCELQMANSNPEAHDIFNKLQKTIKVIKDREVFIKETKIYYRDKTLADLFNIELTMVIF